MRFSTLTLLVFWRGRSVLALHYATLLTPPKFTVGYFRSRFYGGKSGDCICTNRGVRLSSKHFGRQGLSALGGYIQVLAVLIGSMLFVAFVINPILVFWKTRENPYPLVWTCIRVSGLTAFFTRSSAANIPVNMELAQRLGLKEETYSVSIPLGASINMGGAAITITILTLAAVHTLGIEVTLTDRIVIKPCCQYLCLRCVRCCRRFIVTHSVSV